MVNQVDSYYLYLLSNASVDMYAHNTQSDFKNHLPEPLDLENHEVALVEFSYTETWVNVPEDFIAIRAMNAGDDEQKDITVKKGYYPTNDVFFEYLNKLLEDKVFGRSFGFLYDPIRQKVSLKLPPGTHFLLNKDLCEIAGYDAPLMGRFRLLKNDTANFKFFDAEWVADIHRGLYTFFVYCDLVNNMTVGDVKVPLLRTIPIKQRQSVEQVTKEFRNLHYIPLAKSHFQTIRVYITDDQGKPISFQRGKTLVKLHIRRRAPTYL